MKKLSATRVAAGFVGAWTELPEADREQYIKTFAEWLSGLRHRRFTAQVLTEVGRELDRVAGCLPVTVRTAQDLPAAVQEQLSSALSRFTGKTVELHTSLEPSLLGGVVVQVEDTVYDGSVSHQLERFKHNLETYG